VIENQNANVASEEGADSPNLFAGCGQKIDSKGFQKHCANRVAYLLTKKGLHLCNPLISLAPGEGFEPPTGWLTATKINS